MKRIGILVTSALFLCMPVLSAAAGNTEEGAGSEKKFTLVVETGYTLFNEEQFEGAVLVGLRLLYSLAENLNLEIRGTWQSITVKNSDTGLGAGKWTTIPLQLSLNYRFNEGKKISPYILAGIGYYLNRFKLEDEQTWSSLGFEVRDRLDNTLGYHMGGGMDVKLQQSLALNIDIRYCLVSLKGTYSITEVQSGLNRSGDLDGNLNRLMFAAGLKLFF